MDKNGNITIDNFQNGIADSTHLGFSKMVNIDVISSPGVAKINYSTNSYVSSTGGVTGGANGLSAELPVAFALDTRNQLLWAYTSNCSYYSSPLSDLLNWTGYTANSLNTVGSSMVIWEGYLIMAGDLELTAVQLTSNPFIKTDPWNVSGFTAVFDNTSPHPLYVSRDNVLYIGDGTKIHKIKKVGATFDPNLNNTYAATFGFLDTLIKNNVVTSISEIGTYLAVGTRQGGVFSKSKVADIYFWNSNLSNAQFTTKVSLLENGVRGMVGDGQVLYVEAGYQGNLYQVFPSQSLKIKRFSYLGFSNIYQSSINVSPNAITKHNNEILIGISNLANALSPIGVASVNLSPTFELTVKNITSDNYDGSSTPITIGALISLDNDLIAIGRFGGIDIVGRSSTVNGTRYGNYSAYFESMLYPVGTNFNNKSYNKIEFSLAKLLTAGQGVRIKYRKNLSDAWTTITSEACPTGSMDFASLGAVLSYDCPALIGSAEYVQLRVELTTTDTTTPELRAIRLLL